MLPFQYLMAHEHRDSSFVASFSSAFKDVCRSITADVILAVTGTIIKASEAAKKRIESAMIEYIPEPLKRNASITSRHSGSFESLQSIDAGLAADDDGDGTARGPGLLDAISSGIAGLVSLPIEGAENHGIVGLLQGALTGVFEAIAVPVVRLLDAQSRTARSVQALIQSGSELDRVRFPRMMGKEGEVLPYDDEVAIGHVVMRTPFARRKGSLLLCARLLSPNGYLVLTSIYLAVVPALTRRTDLSQSVWLERVADVIDVFREERTLKIIFLETNGSWHDDRGTGGSIASSTGVSFFRKTFRLHEVACASETRAEAVQSSLRRCIRTRVARARTWTRGVLELQLPF